MSRFHCSVDMKCMVSYIQWYHEKNNGKFRKITVKVLTFQFAGSMTLLRTGATQGTPYRYTVKNVAPNNSGFYSCVAGNILGETVSSAYLQVNGANSLIYDVRLFFVGVLICLGIFCDRNVYVNLRILPQM